MSLKLLPTYVNGADTPVTITGFLDPARVLAAATAAGLLQRNVFAGGSLTEEIDASATGTFDLKPWLPIEIDNRNTSQISGFNNANGGTLVVQFRFLLRVTDANINITPRIVYASTVAGLASPTVATVSGSAACDDTADDFSASADQYQTLALTLPANVLRIFKPQITIAGTPSTGYGAIALAMYDCYVLS